MKIQFKDNKAKKLLKDVTLSLTEAQSKKFLALIKTVYESKLFGESQDFTLNEQDIKNVVINFK